MTTSTRQPTVESSLSVFLPNYNHGRFLAEALDALLNQSVRPCHIHIVDDASTDGSRAVIETYSRNYPETIQAVLLERNRGFIANVIDWLAQDDSEFVFFAAADDKVGPKLFEKSIRQLRRFPGAGLCSSCSRLLDEEGNDVGPFYSYRPLEAPGYLSPADAARALMKHDGWFMGNTTVYRGAALRAVGFDRELGAFADGFTCRVLALEHGACFIPEELGFWRRMVGGVASQATLVPSVGNNVAARAQFLMTGKYSTLFPIGYVERWRRRWLFGALSGALNNLPRSELRSHFRELLSPRSAVLRHCLMAMTAFPRRVAILVAFILLRPFDLWPALRRSVSRR